jgi:hypothetical protein
MSKRMTISAMIAVLISDPDQPTRMFRMERETRNPIHIRNRNSVWSFHPFKVLSPIAGIKDFLIGSYKVDPILEIGIRIQRNDILFLENTIPFSSTIMGDVQLFLADMHNDSFIITSGSLRSFKVDVLNTTALELLLGMGDCAGRDGRFGFVTSIFPAFLFDGVVFAVGTWLDTGISWNFSVSARGRVCVS